MNISLRKRNLKTELCFFPKKTVKTVKIVQSKNKAIVEDAGLIPWSEKNCVIQV